MKDGLRHARHLRTLVTIGLGLVLACWPRPPVPPSDVTLQRVLERDFITVHTRNTPFTYYEGRQGPTGFEYELMRRFADRLGVSLNLSDDHHVQSVLDAVRDQGDLGAAALPLDPLAPGLMFSRPILSMQPMVVYRRDLPPPDELDDLLELNIGIAKGTGISRVMHELQQRRPQLSWKEAEDLEIAALLRRVEDGDLDAAVVYAHQFRLNRPVLP